MSIIASIGTRLLAGCPRNYGSFLSKDSLLSQGHQTTEAQPDATWSFSMDVKSLEREANYSPPIVNRL